MSSRVAGLAVSLGIVFTAPAFAASQDVIDVGVGYQYEGPPQLPSPATKYCMSFDNAAKLVPEADVNTMVDACIKAAALKNFTINNTSPDCSKIRLRLRIDTLGEVFNKKFVFLFTPPRSEQIYLRAGANFESPNSNFETRSFTAACRAIFHEFPSTSTYLYRKTKSTLDAPIVAKEVEDEKDGEVLEKIEPPLPPYEERFSLEGGIGIFGAFASSTYSSFSRFPEQHIENLTVKLAASAPISRATNTHLRLSFFYLRNFADRNDYKYENARSGTRDNGQSRTYALGIKQYFGQSRFYLESGIAGNSYDQRREHYPNDKRDEIEFLTDCQRGEAQGIYASPGMDIFTLNRPSMHIRWSLDYATGFLAVGTMARTKHCGDQEWEKGAKLRYKSLMGIGWLNLNTSFQF